MIEIKGIKAFSAAEVAEKLQLSTRTIRRYINAGKLAAVKIGKHVYITENELVRFIGGASNGE